MLLGKAFQSLGAQAEKARSPYDEEILGIVKRDLAEERRVREGGISYNSTKPSL